MVVDRTFFIVLLINDISNIDKSNVRQELLYVEESQMLLAPPRHERLAYIGDNAGHLGG